MGPPSYMRSVDRNVVTVRGFKALICRLCINIYQELIIKSRSETQKMWKYFLSNPSRFPKQYCCFGRFPRFTRLPFWYEQHVDGRQVWSIGRMILTGGNRNTERKNFPSATLSTTNPTRTNLDQTPAFALDISE